MRNDKFRWIDLPYLKFDCLDAPDMSTYSQFASIKDFGSEDVKEESVQERFLPNFKYDLAEISIDSKTFCWSKAFVKPDAVFYDKDKDEYIVVEYKSREFYTLASLTPLAVFQLLVSAEVVRKHIFERTGDKGSRKKIKVRSFMRLNNKVIEVKGWQAMIQHVLAMVPEVLKARGGSSISASELSRSFVLFDSVFKFKPQNQEDARFLGQLNHIRIAKTSERNTKAVKTTQDNDGEISTTTKCPC
ncbi:hypothetical protein A3741_27885 [Oleiphilus sp. HI0069]|nr:hypothetical protein A3741_27885 [Oleiphilus sp. HI0069]